MKRRLETFADHASEAQRVGKREGIVDDDAEMVLCDVCGFECIDRDDYLHERHYEC